MPVSLPETIRLTEPVPGYPVLEIEHPICIAKVALHGAHVMAWEPSTTDSPVLYLSPDAVLREGKAIRGGIPICWPWFNAHPTDPSLPSHGFARTAIWHLDLAEDDEEGVTLHLSFKHGNLSAFAAIRLGFTLEVAVETTNLGDQPCSLSGALHTYLAVTDIDAVRISGLDGCRYLDTVGTPTERIQLGEVAFDQEVDRIYDHADDALLDDGGRIIVVEKEGSPSTVVWNPWIEKSKGLTDLPDDGYRHFVCIEAAISNERAIILAPGGSHTLRTTIRVEEEEF